MKICKMMLPVVFLTAVALFAAGASDFREDPAKYWDFKELSQVPICRPCPEPMSRFKDFEPLLVRGKGPEGSEAEFFCYFAKPEGALPEGGFPAVLFAHGAGGTADPYYVDMWVKTGFAVIALDYYNEMPAPGLTNGVSRGGRLPRIALPGGKRSDIRANVANMVLAHSLLLSRPEVNPKKTAFVGLSWGSWYGAIVAAIDSRYTGAVEIYCGDAKRGDSSLTNGRFLHAAKCPMWWFVSTNDRNVTPMTLAEGWAECGRLAGRTIVNDLPHGSIGFEFAGCMRMARHFTMGEPSLPILAEVKVADGRISAKIVNPGKGVDHAKVAWTESTDEASWKRKWQYAPADVKGGAVCAAVPANATQIYLVAYEKDEGRFGELCGATTFVELVTDKATGKVYEKAGRARRVRMD